MLQIIKRDRELDLGQLCDIYRESLRKDGAAHYPGEDLPLQFLYAQQDFYQFIRSFFTDLGGIYALWVEKNRYVSAVRLERYKDGYLVSGLETSEDMRGQGFATRLLSDLLEYCRSNRILPVYSHVACHNQESIAVHKKAGFEMKEPLAVYLDGSVDHKSITMFFPGK